MELVQASPFQEAPGQLVTRCVAGEDAAWRSLHRRYLPVATKFLRRLGVRDDQLEDTCQEVFLDVFRYLPKFRGESELPTWLYRICMTHARKARRRAHAAKLLSWLMAGGDAEPLVAPHEDDSERRVRLALEELPDHERVVFVLFELEGVPGKRIAEILGCPEATVWRRLHYARQRFRTALVQEGTS